MAAMFEFPDWETFTPDRAAADLQRELAASEKAVLEVENSTPKRFEDLVWKLNDATRSLYLTWGMVSHLTNVMSSDEWRKVEERFQGDLVRFGLRVGQSRQLYTAAKRLLVEDKSLTPIRRRILEKTVQGAELAGVALEGEKKRRYNEIAERLAKLSMDFSNCEIDATKAFTFEKEGKVYTIDDANYPETMKHCADREVRERLYRGRITRAPENAARIPEILALRREKAALLGFGSYAELSLSSKSAPSTAAIFKMIDELDRATISLAALEEKELKTVVEGIDQIKPWDRAYYAERLRERKYSYSEEELKRHFELEQVLRGLFGMAKFLYDIEIVELVGANKPSVWHKDVRFFEVREKGLPIAHFYLDCYVRNGLKQGGAWMNEFRNRRAGVTPLALLVLNLQLPDADGKTYLPMREVETVFHEFGHALQCMLTKVEEEDAAGISLVEWDAVEVASQFNENWCLDERTGLKLPAELKAKVLMARNFREATNCRRQLAFAVIDLKLHMADTVDPDAVKRAEFAHFGLDSIPEDKFLCSFGHIFAGGYAAGYYGYKWAEVMSADCYGAFTEAGLANDAAMKKVGSRFRETVLALGGSESALEVFRRFRGRDVEVRALLEQRFPENFKTKVSR